MLQTCLREGEIVTATNLMQGKGGSDCYKLDVEEQKVVTATNLMQGKGR